MDTEPYREIVNRIDSSFSLSGVRKLEGGMSAQVNAIDVKTQNGIKSFVVRCHGDYDFELNPNVARHEFNVLQAMHTHAIVCPKPIFLDESPDLLGRPYLVMELCSGETIATPEDTADFAKSLAETLFTIHSAGLDLEVLAKFVRHESFAKSLLLTQRRIDSDIDQRTQDLEARIVEYLRENFGKNPSNKDQLLHGDFWHGNILWNNNNISAVVDWEDSCVGDPLIDVANCRFELALLYGMSTAKVFTNSYFELAKNLDRTALSYWDLFALYRIGRLIYTWGLDNEETKRLQEVCNDFADQAFKTL